MSVDFYAQYLKHSSGFSLRREGRKFLRVILFFSVFNSCALELQQAIAYYIEKAISV